MSELAIAFHPDEIRTHEPTRIARLKWVIVVDAALPSGRIANAVTCVAAATSQAVAGLLGPGGTDNDGSAHAGLPWAGCSILSADAAKLRRVRAEAAARDDVFMADMPVIAQETRVYDDYLEQLRGLVHDDIAYAALSLVGPRKRVDRIVGGLGLMH